MAPRGTLYDRLGGDTVVRKVVDDFVARAAADPAVNFGRAGAANEWEATPENLARLKTRLVEFVGSLAGGPTQYQGKDLVTAHRGMAIRGDEFDALTGHLRAALEANNVPRREREELLEMFTGARGAIVETADAPAGIAPRSAPSATDAVDPPVAPDAPDDDEPRPDADR